MDCFAPLAVLDLFDAGIFIEIARALARGNPSDPAANVQPRLLGLSPLILPMDCFAPLAVLDLFDAGIFIEIARALARGNPSDPAAQSSPDC